MNETYPPLPIPASTIISTFQSTMWEVLAERPYLLETHYRKLNILGDVICRALAVDSLASNRNPLGIGSQTARYFGVLYCKDNIDSYEARSLIFAKQNNLGKGIWKLFVMLTDAGAFKEEGESNG